MRTRKLLWVSLMAAELALGLERGAAQAQSVVGTRKTRVQPQAQPVGSAVPDGYRGAAQAAPATGTSESDSGRVSPASSASVSLPAAKPAITVRPGAGLNVVSAAPAVSIETTGPKEINIGKAAAFLISVRNGGETAAQAIVVRASLPDHTELLKASPEPKVQDRELQFEIGELLAKGEQKLRVEIIPHQPGPVELATTLSFSVSTQSALVVRQPQLAMTCAGPEEAMYGELVTLNLKVTNTGDGPAEEVTVTQVQDPDQGDTAIAQLPTKIGVLGPGQSHDVELRVPASTAGMLRATLMASASGDLEAKVTTEVRVRRPMLEVKAEGPVFRYAHRPGNYAIHLSNPGDAPAKTVSVTAQIPPGLQVTAIEKRAVFNKEKGTISWELPQIDAGAEVILQYRTKGVAEGEQSQQIVATAEAGLKAEATHVTRVESIADVVMTVTDTPGPIELGGTVDYEIRIKNRGTKSAQNVRVRAAMPAALEVVVPEQCTEFVAQDGAVQFAPIGELAANEEKILHVRALGRKAGDHTVRVTLQTDSLAREVVAEESTMFYSGEMPSEAHGR